MLRGLKYKVFEMKKTVLFVSLAAAALLLSSCFGKQESRYTYKCGFSFDPDDPYSGIPSSSFNSDSLYFPENGFSCSDFVYLGSKVSSDELSGGWAASMCKDPVAAEGHAPKNGFAVFGNKGGVENTRGFAVFYDNPDASKMPDAAIQIPTYANPAITQLVMYVNNTNAVVNSILFGDQKFGPGDYFLLTISGYKGSTKIGDIEVYLADYRGEVPILIRDWTEVKLDAISAADVIQFSLKSTKEGTPRYFCIDDYVCQIEITY